MKQNTQKIVDDILTELVKLNKPLGKYEILRYIKNKGIKMSIMTLHNYMKTSDVKIQDKTKHVGSISERIMCKKPEVDTLYSEGMSITAISKIVGISPQCVSKLINLK